MSTKESLIEIHRFFCFPTAIACRTNKVLVLRSATCSKAVSTSDIHCGARLPNVNSTLNLGCSSSRRPLTLNTLCIVFWDATCKAHQMLYDALVLFCARVYLFLLKFLFARLMVCLFFWGVDFCGICASACGNSRHCFARSRAGTDVC